MPKVNSLFTIPHFFSIFQKFTQKRELASWRAQPSAVITNQASQAYQACSVRATQKHSLQIAVFANQADQATRANKAKSIRQINHFSLCDLSELHERASK